MGTDRNRGASTGDVARAESVWVVILARVGDGAKSRLAPELTPPRRQALALAMLADVVDVCVAAGLGGVLVVTDLPEARLAVERAGAFAVADPGSGEMNEAAISGIDAARARGATTAIILPGDVPLIASRDLHILLEAAAAAPRAVIVGAAHDGRGTNALLLRPPDVITPSFGPPSMQRHVRLGVAAGALTAVCRDLGLARDIDTPSDLAALRHAGPGRRIAAALATRVHNQPLVP